MKVVRFDVARKEEWNNIIAREPSFSIFQSWDWGEFKEKLGWKAFRLAVCDQHQISVGAQMLVKPFFSNLYSIAYIPRGPVGNWTEKQSLTLLFSEIHRIARNQNTIFLKIEPPLKYDPTTDWMLQDFQFQPSQSTNQPRSTIIIDLSPSLEEIYQRFRPTTKQRIKSSIDNGVTIRTGDFKDIQSFYDLMKITSKRERFRARSRSYYENEWHTFANKDKNVLLLATYNDEILAVHMGYRFGDHAAYFHGASKLDRAKLHPNHLLVWEGIKWAKRLGSRTYDLWGIPDEVGQAFYLHKTPPKSDRTDGLWGVYQFKSGFSKNIVFYSGAYDYIYKPVVYTILMSSFLSSKKMEQLSVFIESISRK